MRTILSTCLLLVLCSPARAQLVTAAMGGSAPDKQHLVLSFGAEDDKFNLVDDAEGYLTIQWGPDWYTAGDRVLVDGNPVLVANLDFLFLELGPGDDTLVDPIIALNGCVVIIGGPGNDSIKCPTGLGVTVVFGGPGNDTISGEHSETNVFFAGPGSDQLNGGQDGWNYLDPGSDGGSMQTFKNKFRKPYDEETVAVYHVGSNTTVIDGGAHNRYLMRPGSGIGNLFIWENGGLDTIQWNGMDPFTVQGSTIDGDWLTGDVYGWDSIENK